MYNYWSQDTSESIEHHGILGQKWGVRRYQNEDGSLTEAGRKRYLKGSYNPVSTEAMREMKIIKTGTKLYRVVPNEKRANANGTTYVTYTEPDRDLYKGLYNAQLIERNKNNGIINTAPHGYEVEYEAKKALKIASRKTLKQVEQYLTKDNDFKNRCINSVLTNRKGRIFYEVVREHWNDFDYDTQNKLYEYYLKSNATLDPASFMKMVFGDSKFLKEIEPKVADDYTKNMAQHKKDIEKRVNDEPEYAYNAFITGITLDNKVRDTVVSMLKTSGFEGITDEHGVKSPVDIEGLDPLLLFDGSDALRKVKINEINDESYNSSYDRGSKWYNEINKKYSTKKDIIKWSAI